MAVRRVRVRVPATTSNLGPGFDVLGMALRLHNEAEVEIDPRRRGLAVEIAGEGASGLPRDASNLAVRSFRRAFRGAMPPGLAFRLTNRIPLARGLGSSAAARLCGLLAAGALQGRGGAPAEELVELACRLEGHPDNVAPAFFGGLRACRLERGRLSHFALRVPPGLGVAVCIPDFQVSTDKARAVLPRRVALKDAVATSSGLAFLIGAFERGRPEWLASAMRDVLHQPYRRPLVRGLDSVLRAALRAGAYGAALSGSGPAVLALGPRGRRLKAAGDAMRRAFARAGSASRVLCLDVDRVGARVEVR